MGYIISIGLSLLLLLTGCASQHDPQVQAERKKVLSKKKTAAQEIAAFQSTPKKKRRVVGRVFPEYQKIPALRKKKVTFSAEEANLRQVLYSIVGGTGLNLVIDKDVDASIPITISVKEAQAQNVLNTLMSMSGYHYTVRGNMLHVKSFMQKMFIIPYIQSTTSMKTQLGGDMLNSAQSGGEGGSGDGIKGDFSLKFDNPKKTNSFYEQLEDNIKALISPEGRYTLNRSSGVLSVYDKKDRVDVIETVINKIKKRSQKQVLIEAKILEVVLNDDHNLGVSWEAIADEVIRSGDQFVLQQTLGLESTVAGTMSYTAKNFNAIITALNASGDIDMLSNPRIKVLSGQSAMITSGKLVPFWEKEVQTTAVGSVGTAALQEVIYNRRDVLNGITMGVTAVIMEDGRIMLNIVPITSSIEKVVEHFDEDGKSVASAPILNVKEAGTIIYANDNDLVSIGGLINNTVSKTQEKIPGLGDLPGLGQIFTKTINTDEKRELVILMKLTIVE